MRLSTLCMVTLLAAGGMGIAQATPINVISNGDFSQTTGTPANSTPAITTPTQFGTGSKNGFAATQFITNWVGNNGYEIWYSSPSDAMNINATGEWTGTGEEKLWETVTTAPNGTQTFVGLDGDITDGIQSSIGQQLTGLSIGATYTFSFDWAAAQLQSRTGDTTEMLDVSFDGVSAYKTKVLDNPSKSFTGWESVSFQYTATSTSAFLNFLSVGTPTGLPPMALLTNVSMTQNVSEPPELALFGGGLLGLGLLIMVARRREMQRRDADGKNATV